MKNGTTIDYFVLAFLFFILVGIGVYFAKRMKGGKDYFSGGNQLPWWVSGISLFTGSFSAWTFTGAAGFVYQTEWLGIIYFILWSVTCYIGSQLTAGRWRRTRGISPVEYTKIRYNQTTQQVIGYVVLLNALLGLGVGLAAVSKVIAYSMGIPIELVIICSGISILFYTFLGGIWAVAIADVVKFIILIGITIVILPLSLKLVGGYDVLFSKLGAVNLNQTYKGEQYNIFWIFAIILLNIFSNGNQAQKYYSVEDEKSARKVGILSSLLFISVPILFGTPPLVAKVLWPDLAQVPFFQGQSVPAESVFIAVVLQVLPNGLIGVFLAAMLSATFSTLDSAYSSTAAILSKDLYGGIFKPQATDRQIMRFGRISTLAIGIVTIIMAIIYCNSQFGLFNWTMTFVALFTLPITVPLVLGLLIKSLKRWSGLTTILLGLVINIVTKYLLGLSFGFQILGMAFFCTIFIISSNLLAEIYKKNKLYSAIISIFVAFLISILFTLLLNRNLSSFETFAMYFIALIIGLSIYAASKLYAYETEDDKKIVEEFFVKLSTPINLLDEVYSKGVRQISAFPIIGKITILIGCLISILAFFNMSQNEVMITLALSFVLIIIGFLMSYFGSRSEKQYMLRLQTELQKRGLK